MSEYHYIQSEPGLWTVGTGRPGKGGDWEPESDHESPEAAAERVRYLNGGYGTSKDAAYISKLESRITELEAALALTLPSLLNLKAKVERGVGEPLPDDSRLLMAINTAERLLSKV